MAWCWIEHTVNNESRVVIEASGENVQAYHLLLIVQAVLCIFYIGQFALSSVSHTWYIVCK